MSNANLGDFVSPVNDKIEELAKKIRDLEQQVITKNLFVSRVQQFMDSLLDPNPPPRPPAVVPVVPAAAHSPEKPLRKNSRKDMQEQREIFAMVTLSRMGGIPDIHAVAEVMAGHFGSFHFASLYRYERFMGLYKMLRKQAIAAARDSMNRGFQLSKKDGGGIEAIDDSETDQ